MNLPDIPFQVSVNKQEMINHVVNETVSVLDKAIQERGSASFFVSGGTTPVIFYNMLKEVSLDWSKVNLSLIDERLNCDISDKNIDTLKRLFIDLLPVKPNLLSLEEKLDWLNEISFQPADLMWLGMGNDGHIASLFKETDFISSKMGYINTISPKQPYNRISMTMNRLAQSGNIFLLLPEKRKREDFLLNCDKNTAILRILKDASSSISIYTCDDNEDA